MSGWVSFKYKNHLGKTVGHTAFVNSKADLTEIFDRYQIDPKSIWDVRVTARSMSIAEMINKLSA